MKNVMTAAALGCALVLTTTFLASAQCGANYKWPTDGVQKSKAEESLVILKDNRTNSPKQAIAAFNWLVTNTPDLNKSLYIYGADIYETLAKNEKDAAKQGKYADSLSAIYDLRIKNTECGDKASTLNRKALAAYPYLLNSDRVKDLSKMMEETLTLNGEKIMDGTLVPYMQTVYMMKVKYNALTDDEAMDKYDAITDIIDAKMKAAKAANKPTDKLEKYRDDVDKVFNTMDIQVDCARVKAKLEPKYKANPNDIDLSKKIFYSMLRGKCTDDPLWLETAEKVYADSPDFGIAKNLAIKYLAQDNEAKSDEWFKKALSIAATPADKAETMLFQARIEAKKGSKSSARDLARQAANADASTAKDAYELIGDLYMNSGKDCAKEKSYAEDRLVYLAAYEMYAKAGDSKKMAQAKSQFPSTSEIFEVGWKEGDSKRIEGCWLGETVTVRTRGKD